MGTARLRITLQTVYKVLFSEFAALRYGLASVPSEYNSTTWSSSEIISSL